LCKPFGAADFLVILGNSARPQSAQDFNADRLLGRLLGGTILEKGVQS
jgi:hypothetical protein